MNEQEFIFQLHRASDTDAMVMFLSAIKRFCNLYRCLYGRTWADGFKVFSMLTSIGFPQMPTIDDYLLPGRELDFESITTPRNRTGPDYSRWHSIDTKYLISWINVPHFPKTIGSRYQILNPLGFEVISRNFHDESHGIALEFGTHVSV
jgi:hypothetical protein